jgi:hypothetical protein
MERKMWSVKKERRPLMGLIGWPPAIGGEIRISESKTGGVSETSSRPLERLKVRSSLYLYYFFICHYEQLNTLVLSG